MNFKEYQEQAIRTESVPKRINFGKTSLFLALNLGIAASQVLDQVKRAIYYGKGIDKDKTMQSLQIVDEAGGLLGDLVEADMTASKDDDRVFLKVPELIRAADLAHLNVRILHSALGIFTEGGEALEVVLNQLTSGEFDGVNWGEEIGGDVSWYQAIGHDAAGTDETDERVKNIAKLRARYPAKFDQHAAVNRNLVAERAVLEGAAEPALA